MVPALAVAAALRDRGARVSFLGTRERAEADLVSAAGYEIDFLRVVGLDRRNPLRAAVAVARAAGAVGSARRLLRRRGADVVLGGGGYVAGPAGLAAATLRIPLVLAEADSHLGLANRLLAWHARRICLAFPIPGREGGRYVVTGRPVPAAVLEADRDLARARFGIEPTVPCLLVFGGSLGARSVNEAAIAAFAEHEDATRDFHVLHITGLRDHAELRERCERAAPSRYTLVAYEDDLGEALAACDLVVARAGGSIFELAAAGRPAILVPYPHATGDHQRRNASWMIGAGAAVLIEDRELGPDRLRNEASELIHAPERLREMASAARAIALPDAAQRIASEALAAAGGGRS